MEAGRSQPVGDGATNPPQTGLEPRLLNWGDVWRQRLGYGLERSATAVSSAEGGYRNRWRASWDSDPLVGCAPLAPRTLDRADAEVIELGVCALDLFHHCLLKAWFIRRIGAIGALNFARTAAHEQRIFYRTTADAERECAARLRMAETLLGRVLVLPAVVRKERARAHVRVALGLEIIISA